jgi:hypothetical protein
VFAVFAVFAVFVLDGLAFSKFDFMSRFLQVCGICGICDICDILRAHGKVVFQGGRHRARITCLWTAAAPYKTPQYPQTPQMGEKAVSSQRAVHPSGIQCAHVPPDPLHVLIDRTGLQVYGAGQWLEAKHGANRAGHGASCIWRSMPPAA